MKVVKIIEGGIEMEEKELKELIGEFKTVMNIDKKIENKKAYDELILDVITYTSKAVTEMHTLDMNKEEDRNIVKFRVEEITKLSELLYVLDKII